jgi:hypothetical protein
LHVLKPFGARLVQLGVTFIDKNKFSSLSGRMGLKELHKLSGNYFFFVWLQHE